MDPGVSALSAGVEASVCEALGASVVFSFDGSGVLAEPALGDEVEPELPGVFPDDAPEVSEAVGTAVSMGSYVKLGLGVSGQAGM